MQRQLQRATIRSIQVLGPLGRGAYAEVHLVAVPVDGQLKLCAQKLLLLAPPPTPAAMAAPQQGNSSSNSSCCAPPPRPSPPEPPSRQQLKLSSAGDFQRERSMHQLCFGCPFIVQVLAAKTAPAAMLLLMQFAEHGSLAQAYQVSPGGTGQAGQEMEVYTAASAGYHCPGASAKDWLHTVADKPSPSMVCGPQYAASPWHSLLGRGLTSERVFLVVATVAAAGFAAAATHFTRVFLVCQRMKCQLRLVVPSVLVAPGPPGGRAP